MFVPIRKYKIAGQSMMPSLRNGSVVLASSFPYLFFAPKKGDLIVIDHPKKHIPLVKRIARINHNVFFVVGDNSSVSSDSRSFGWIRREKIIAKVVRS